MEEETLNEGQAAAKTVLEVKGLSKAYGARTVIDDVSFKIAAGEVVSIIGKNGIGKSTTIDCVVGLKRKNAGEIKIGGISLDEDPVNAKFNFGYVPSEPILYETMTGKEYLNFIGSCYQVTEREFRASYKALVAYFDLSETDMNKRIANYSHGMKQKICLMASVIHNPDLWILDEPSVGLDIVTNQQLIKLIIELRDHGRGVFIASHNIDLVCEVSSRVLILNNGKLEKELDLIASPYLKKELRNIFINIYRE